MTFLASLTVADDLLTAVNGKVDIRGIFTNDILIQGDSAPVSQMVFVFHYEGEQSDLPQVVRFQVHLPGEELPRNLDRPVPPGWKIPEGREKWGGLTPFSLGPVILRPGKIRAAILLDERRIDLLAPRIVNSSAWPQPSEKSQSGGTSKVS